MIRKILSTFFVQNRKESDNEDIIALKSSYDFRKQNRHNNIQQYKNADAFYNKNSKELLIRTKDSETKSMFPFDSYGYWRFDSNNETNNYDYVYILDRGNSERANTLIAEILQIEMKNVGINGEIHYTTDNKCIFELDSDEDYAMFSLYFSEYINYIPTNSNYGFVTSGNYMGAGMMGGGGGGGVAFASYGNSSHAGVGGVVVSCYGGGGGGSSGP